MKKLLSYRGLMGFIYALVMLLPFSAIALRCAYVTFNKNAKDSYSQYVDTITTNVSLTDNLVNGQTYTINPLAYINTSTTTYYEVLDNQTNIKDLFFPNDTRFNTITKFGMATSGVRTRLIVYYNSNDNGSVFDITDSFYFVSNGVNETNNQSSAWWTITTLSYNTGKLDNAFDYSLQSFIDENGVGRLNLTNWFVDIFLDNTTHNMLYINYINWYMNYSLLVSCVYLLYLVLMWFITLARRLLTSFDEKGSLGL